MMRVAARTGGGAGLFLLAALAAAAAKAGETITLHASKDNGLYENVDGLLSNGSGEYFFAGRTLGGDFRRGLIAFDVAAAAPAGAVIESATLRLYMSRTIVGSFDVSMHRATASWGEGPANADGEEGAGAPAAVGDATWRHRFYPATPWTSPGGDFVATASATTTIDNTGWYSWSSPALADDVQDMLDAPAQNFGWFVLGDESTNLSAKRFNSRTTFDAATLPVLELTYSVPAGCPGDLNCDGVRNFGDIDPFVLALQGQAAYEAVYPGCRWLNADVNGDATVNFGDIDPFVGLLGAGPCP